MSYFLYILKRSIYDIVDNGRYCVWHDTLVSNLCKFCKCDLRVNFFSGVFTFLWWSNIITTEIIFKFDFFQQTLRMCEKCLTADTRQWLLLPNYRLHDLGFWVQPIYSFRIGVPKWPLFLWWFPISLYYKYALYCKCWELPILTSGMLTSEYRVFPGSTLFHIFSLGLWLGINLFYLI